MKVGVISLGCSKNLVDTEVLLGKLKANNVKFVKDSKKAEVIIINTCGFINPAKEESINTILEHVKGKKVIVMGCLVQRYKEELQKEIPEVTAYFGTESWDHVVGFLGLKSTKESKRLITTPKSYAYLKIAEGCNRLCSFCTIPKIRGRHRSRPMEELLEEARYIADQGISEICIVSQDTTYYGRDLYGENKLVELIKRLEKIEGIRWIRLLYLYPTEIDERLIKHIGNSEKTLPYLDIPIQHTSDRVLRSMRRGYNGRFLRSLLKNIKENIPNAVLRATLIVGYPEEGDEDFKALKEFVSEGYFHWVGVFTYSHEEDTYAYQLGDRLTEEEKEMRRQEVLAIQEEETKRRNQEFLGKELDLVVDEFAEEVQYVPVGRVYFQAPEVDGITYVESEETLKPGQWIKVKITQVGGYDLGAKKV
ncbi:MAG: 30S ribosomal protein S12 methylthiotransferase RimO [Aquificaceae bacterium]